MTTPPAPPPEPAPAPKEAQDTKKAEQPSEKTLLETLSSADPEVRSTAAVALSKRGPSVIPALIDVLELGNAGARKDAHWVLREITHETLPAEAESWRKWGSKQNKGAEVPAPGK